MDSQKYGIFINKNILAASDLTSEEITFRGKTIVALPAVNNPVMPEFISTFITNILDVYSVQGYAKSPGFNGTLQNSLSGCSLNIEDRFCQTIYKNVMNI